MHIQYFSDFESMSQKGADLVHFEITQKPDLLFCVASGGSPAGLYKLMSEKHQINQEFFQKIRIIKLDEWVGLPMGSKFSSEFDVQNKLLKKINIPASRYIAFDDQTNDPSQECLRVQKELQKSGPIDICILGIGQNGHIALNEPGENKKVDCHVASLSEKTLSSGMIEKVGVNLEYGMTLGLGAIFDSKMIILFITGKGKKEAFQKLLKKEVSTHLPASLIWLHPNVHVLVDESSIG